MLVLLAVGVPFAFALGGLAVLFGLIIQGDSLFPFVIFRMWDLMNSFSTIALPLFVFMANVLSRSGMANELYATFYNWAGPLKGALAVATVYTCAVIGAMVGTAGSDIILMGLIALPFMLRQGYSKSLACGSVLAGGGLGVVIPPSILFIIYGLLSETSIGKLFMGGVVPGVILATMYALYIIGRGMVQPQVAPALPKEARVSGLMQNLALVKKIILPSLLILAVLGSIYTGMATPSEAAGLGAVGAIAVAGFRRQLTWGNMKMSVYGTARTIGMILWIIFAASSFVGVFIVGGGGDFIRETLLGLGMGRWGTLIVIQLILILLGMFLEPISILILTVPIVMPIVAELRFDMVWYGVLFVINMQMAYITPPFGPSLFYLKGVAPPEITLDDIYRSVPPFIIIQGITLTLLMIFPQIALWLPGMMIK
jgi:tripartite ATP-independent transporter DctM subunit